MRHVLRLVQQFCDTQVPDLDFIVLAQKHVDGFDISMQNFILVQVPESQTHFNEELPYFGLRELPAHLSFEILAQIAILAILHDDIDRIPGHKRIQILNAILAMNLRHNRGFQHRLSLLIRRHLLRLNNFHHIRFLILFPTNRIHHTKRSLSELRQLFKVVIS